MSFDSRFTADGDLRSLPLEELVALLGCGDPIRDPVFSEIIARFEPLLRRAWRTSNGTEYREFANEVFVRLFGGLESLREPRAFPGFFHSIVRSVAGDFRRRATRQSADNVEDLPELIAPGDQLALRIVIRSYLEHLPERERRVLELDFIDGYSVDELSKIIGMTPGGIRTLKRRALQKLRTMVNRDTLMLERVKRKLTHRRP